MPDFDAADRQHESRLLGGEILDRLIGRDPVFVEAAGLLARFEYGRLHSGDGERVSAGQSRRSRADDRDPFAGRGAARIGRFAAHDHRIGGVALQLADDDGLAFGGLAHAGLLA